MNLVIPMAGRGSRFEKEGYEKPKFYLTIEDKTLLEYSLESLPFKSANKIIFIILNEHEIKWNVSAFIKSKYGDLNLEFVFLKDVTRGQSETVLAAEKLINNNEQLLIYNIDTYFRSNTLEKNVLSKDCDGYIGAFEDEEDKWSFAKTDENGWVIETTEKVPISTHALTGMYHFSQGKDFVRVAKKAIKNNDKVKNEFYIAPLYNQLIKEGKKFKLDFVADFVALGTPQDFEHAKSEKRNNLNSSKS